MVLKLRTFPDQKFAKLDFLCANCLGSKTAKISCHKKILFFSVICQRAKPLSLPKPRQQPWISCTHYSPTGRCYYFYHAVPLPLCFYQPMNTHTDILAWQCTDIQDWKHYHPLGSIAWHCSEIDEVLYRDDPSKANIHHLHNNNPFYFNMTQPWWETFNHNTFWSSFRILKLL